MSLVYSDINTRLAILIIMAGTFSGSNHAVHAGARVKPGLGFSRPVTAHAKSREPTPILTCTLTFGDNLQQRHERLLQGLPISAAGHSFKPGQYSLFPESVDLLKQFVHTQAACCCQACQYGILDGRNPRPGTTIPESAFQGKRIVEHRSILDIRSTAAIIQVRQPGFGSCQQLAPGSIICSPTSQRAKHGVTLIFPCTIRPFTAAQLRIKSIGIIENLGILNVYVIIIIQIPDPAGLS